METKRKEWLLRSQRIQAPLFLVCVHQVTCGFRLPLNKIHNKLTLFSPRPSVAHGSLPFPWVYQDPGRTGRGLGPVSSWPLPDGHWPGPRSGTWSLQTHLAAFYVLQAPSRQNTFCTSRYPHRQSRQFISMSLGPPPEKTYLGQPPGYPTTK